MFLKAVAKYVAKYVVKAVAKKMDMLEPP